MKILMLIMKIIFVLFVLFFFAIGIGDYMVGREQRMIKEKQEKSLQAP